MQYTININQRLYQELGVDVSLNEAAILRWMYLFSVSGDCEKYQFKGHSFYWFSYSKILSDLPMLTTKSASGVKKLVAKMVDAGLLFRHPNSEKMNKSLFAFTPVAHQINLDGVSKNSPNKPLQPSESGRGKNKNAPKSKISRPNRDGVSKEKDSWPSEMGRGPRPNRDGYNNTIDILCSVVGGEGNTAHQHDEFILKQKCTPTSLRTLPPDELNRALIPFREALKNEDPEMMLAAVLKSVTEFAKQNALSVNPAAKDYDDLADQYASWWYDKNLEKGLPDSRLMQMVLRKQANNHVSGFRKSWIQNLRP